MQFLKPSRVKPLLKMGIEALQHFLVNAPHVGEAAPPCEVGVLPDPSNSTINSSSSSPRSRYLSRRCRLQVSAVCLWRLLVPSPTVKILTESVPRF